MVRGYQDSYEVRCLRHTAISFFKFTKEDLAPLPYYSFPNSYVQSAAATGSAYRWVDLLYHAFRKEAALKCGELGLKPPGDPTEAAMFAKGKDLFKTKLVILVDCILPFVDVKCRLVV